MKYIDNASEIDLSFSSMINQDTTVYILSGGVIVSNINRSKEAFFSRSFGSSYENPEYFTAIATTDGKSLLQHWIDQSKY